MNETPDFACWTTDNLVKFAQDATERMKAQDAMIELLKADLRTAIEAYRSLMAVN
jgi:hypothetical protein